MREKKGVRNRCVHPFYFLLFPLHEHCKSLYQHCKSIFTLTQYLSIPYFNSHICIRRRQIISLPVSTHTYYSWLLSASLLLCQVSRATHYSITLNMIRSDSAKRKYLSLFNYIQASIPPTLSVQDCFSNSMILYFPPHYYAVESNTNRKTLRYCRLSRHHYGRMPNSCGIAFY